MLIVQFYHFQLLGSGTVKIDLKLMGFVALASSWVELSGDMSFDILPLNFCAFIFVGVVHDIVDTFVIKKGKLALEGLKFIESCNFWSQCARIDQTFPTICPSPISNKLWVRSMVITHQWESMGSDILDHFQILIWGGKLASISPKLYIIIVLCPAKMGKIKIGVFFIIIQKIGPFCPIAVNQRGEF